MKTVVCQVEGMKCNGCAQKIYRSIAACDADAKANVDLEKKEVTITSTHQWSPFMAKMTIESAGFKLLAFKKLEG